MKQKRVQSFVENTKCDGEPSNVFPLNPILREMIYLKNFTFAEFIFEEVIFNQCFLDGQSCICVGQIYNGKSESESLY